MEPSAAAITSPGDFVAAVPSLVGFHPDESLVVVCLHGPRKSSGLTMRADLPEPGCDEWLAAEMADELARRVVNAGADAAALVCYTAVPDDAAGLPYRTLVDRQLEKLRQRGVGVVNALLVRSGRWWSYTCTQPCCPPSGSPIAGGVTGEVARLEAERALAGRAVLGSRTELEASVRGPANFREIAVGQLYDRIGDEFALEVERHGLDVVRKRTVELARARYARFRAGNRDLEDESAVRILVGLEDRLARDELTTWALDGQFGELIAFFTDLAQCALDGNAAPVCTVLASVAYQCGDGALAAVALERALQCRPGYEMAGLLYTLLSEQVQPAKIREVIEHTRQQLSAGTTADGNAAA